MNRDDLLELVVRKIIFGNKQGRSQMITSDKDNVVAGKLNRFIDDNLDKPSFTVDTICQAFGVSRSQLHRIVKEQTDRSTSLYIRNRRLLKARDLLIATDLRISEIGDLVGITNPQNFSSYFIEEFKVSPSEFRKQRSRPPEMDLPPTQIIPVPISAPVAGKPVAFPASQPRFLNQRGWVYAGVVAALLLIIGAGLYGWYQNRPSRQPSEPVRNSIAVLPFTNLGTSDSGPACEGIMEDVHRSLSLIKNLKVISRSSSNQYKNAKKSIWQIGDELQVANVLKGSVLKTSDRIQIKVEIIRAQDDIQVWVKKYSAAYQDIFQLTDQIVRDVAGQLKLAINASASELVALARTQNPDAYNVLLQGRQLLVSRMDADLLASLVRFDRALALDSTFAEAYALKAVAYHLLVGSKKIDTPELHRLTEESALKAIRLDPTNSTAYGVLGSLYYTTYQWQASENAFRIALQHNPNDAQVHHWYALLLRTTGRLDEAIRYSAQAIALDPLHPVMMSVYISNCSLAGRFDLARAGIETGRGLFDKSFSFQLGEAYYWLCRADYSRAATHFQQMMVLNPDDTGQTPILMYCEAKRGNRRKAIAFLQNLKATTARADYERAVVYAGLNQADSSLHYLKKAADGGYLYRDTNAMPPFKPYHSHPVYKAIMRQFKLP